MIECLGAIISICQSPTSKCAPNVLVLGGGAFGR